MLSRQHPTQPLPVAPVPVELLQTELQVYLMVFILNNYLIDFHVALRSWCLSRRFWATTALTPPGPTKVTRVASKCASRDTNSFMVARSYLRLAGAARQPENRCPKRKLSIRHAQVGAKSFLAGRPG